MKRVLVLLALLVARPAAAHDQPYSYLDLRLGGSAIQGRVAAHVIDIAHESGLDADSLREPLYLARMRERVERVFLERIDVTVGERKLIVHPTALSPVPD